MASVANASIAGNIVSGIWTPNAVFGSTTLQGSKNLPPLPSIDFLNGIGAGQINRIGFASGTLTNVTPGTTDTATINLASLTNLDGGTFTDLVSLVALLILNDAVTAGCRLEWDGTLTNSFSDFFDAIATDKVKINPGHVDPTTGLNRPGGLLFWSGAAAGYTVDATHRIITLLSGSAVSLPYRLIAFGRSAALP